MKDKDYRKDLYQMLWLKQKLALPEDPMIPRSIKKQLRQTVKNYFDSDTEHQRLARMTISLRGKTDKYVFQMSNGSQQLKLYEPHKYKNHINTPLRIRTRMIMHLAHQASSPDVREKIKELHYTYPYYMLKDEPVNLRLRNFRFKKSLRETDPLEIYRKTSGSEPDPAVDQLIYSVSYQPGKSIKLEYEDREEEQFYAVNTRNNDISNVLLFVWSDELQQLP